MVLKEVIFNSFYFGRMWWSEITDFLQFPYLEDVVVLKEVIFTLSILDSCGGLERRDF